MRTSEPGRAVQLSASESVVSFQLAPDGARVVYEANVAFPGDAQLLVAPVDGSSAAQLLAHGQSLGFDASGRFVITSDGSRVVYADTVLLTSDPLGPWVEKIYSVPLDGSASPVQLDDVALPTYSRVTELEISPDSARVVYVSNQNDVDTYELFVAAIDGTGSPLRLNPPLVPGGDVGRFEISSDGTRVVYSASTGAFELYSVPIDGNAAAIPLTSAPASIQWFDLSADGMRVLYLTYEAPSAELFCVPSDGSSAAVKLNAPLTTNGNVSSNLPPLFSPDGSRVVYAADQDSDGVVELYSVPSDASAAPVKLNGPMVSGGSVQAFAISPDGTHVVYRADQEHDEEFDLFSAPSDGSAPATRLNSPSPAADVQTFQFTPDGARVLYRADELVDGRTELFRVPTGGGSAPVRVNDSLVAGGNVGSMFTDGTRVLYNADQDHDQRFELFLSHIRRTARPR